MGIAILRQLVSRRLGQRRFILDRIRRRRSHLVWNWLALWRLRIWIPRVWWRLQLFPNLGHEQFRGLGIGLGREHLALQRLHEPLLRHSGRRPAGADDDCVRLLATDQRDVRAPGRFRRREHRAGVLGRARRVQGRRLPACPGTGGPGFEADPERGGRARVPSPGSVRAQAVRRGGLRRLCRPHGRTGLELVDHGGALSGRRHLHESAQGPGGLCQEQPDVGLSAVLARLPLSDYGPAGGGGRPVRESAPDPAQRSALSIVRQAVEEGSRAARGRCRRDDRTAGGRRRRPTGRRRRGPTDGCVPLPSRPRQTRARDCHGRALSPSNRHLLRLRPPAWQAPGRRARPPMFPSP